MDYPRNIAVPTHINSLNRWCGGATGHSTASPGMPSTQAWTANVAVYIPMMLPWPFQVQRMFWCHGSAVSGHSDIGIYTAGGALVWSAGSTVNAGTASSLQYVAVSPDIMLQPGQTYYMAYANDGTTNQYLGSATGASTGRMAGLMQQATALPLPPAATFAQYAGVGYPLIGITSTASGF